MVTKASSTFLKKKILFLVILLLPSIALFAQATANFTADIFSGCAPVLVNFTNNSSNATSYSWDLGNGNTSSNMHTSALYAQPGIYTVKLTATGVGAPNTKTATIVVYGPPSAEFKANKTALCGNEPLTFTDLSIAQSAGVNAWFWSFGDGQISNAQNPTHLYNQDGKYSVYLQVTDANGCKASTTKTNHININQPKANFAADSFVCAVPADIQFTNKSSGLNLSYLWEFGDGSTSTAKSPVHTYNAFDTLPVKLTISSVGSACSATITKDIRIARYIADFTYIATCNNSAQNFTLNFNNTSNPVVKSEWTFGDGDTSTAKAITHQYASKGKYTITLKSTYSNTCFDTVVKTYESPNASFLYSSLPCKAPFKVNYTNTSKGTGISSSWNFSDGKTSTAKNPSTIFTAPPYNARTILTETNTWGCADIDTQYFSFPMPIAVVVPDTPFTGCAPLTVTFKSNSYAYNSNIVAYKWNFGDPSSGANNTASTKNSSHNYADAGLYDVKLFVQNDSGCVDSTVYKKLVKTGIKPSGLDFSMSDDSTCYNTSKNFNDLSTYTPSSVKANYWCWDWYGDNANILLNENKKPVSCPDSGNANPNSNYTSVKTQTKNFNKKEAYKTLVNGGSLYAYDAMPDTGMHYIHMIVGNNGCYAEVKKSFFVKGTMASPNFVFPNGEFSLSSCNPPLNIGLSNGSSQYSNTNYFNVVNNQTNDTITKISGSDTNFINLNKAGTYSINISVSNPVLQCSNSDSKTIAIDSIIHKVYIPKKGCLNTPVKLINMSTSSYGQISKKAFDFGNGETIEGSNIDTVNYVYGDTGTFVIKSYTFSMVNGSVNGAAPDYKQCSVMHTDTIHIDGVKAKFSVPKNMYCEGETVEFSDSSYSTTPYTLRRWRFGDNKTSSQINPQHKYYQIKSYDVSYVLQNSAGCKDSIYFPNLITLSKPNADFTQNKTLACYGDTIRFTNTGTGLGLNYKWDFGQGDTSNLTHPRNIYNQAGVFNVALVTTSSYGCKDTLLKTALIDVENYPTVKFGINDSVGDCSPFLATFSDSSITNITQWEWNFQEGNVSFSKNPLTNYTHPGKFNVKLTVSTKNGCSSSLTKMNYVTVNGPYGTYTIQNDSGCVPLNTVFVQDFKQTNYYTWDFGDGNAQSFNYLSNPNSTNHTYNSKGLFTPQIQLLDTNNCSSVMNLENVYAEKVISDFDASDTLLCALGSVQFTNTTTSQFPLSYYWNFDDLNFGTQESPVHAFGAQKKYNVKLIATSVIEACADTITREIAVYKSPNLKLDTLTKLFCIPYNAQFNITNNDPSVAINKLYWSHNNDLQESTFANYKINTLGAQSFNFKVDYANNLCQIDSLIILKALLPPVAKFSFSPDHPSVNTTVDFTEACESTTQWLWKISDNATSNLPNPSHDFFKNGDYLVTLYASNEGLCIDSMTATVRVAAGEFVKLMSGFTPNGDGINDYAKILNAGNVTLVDFTIYNRWGQQVFKTDTIEKYWDGTFNGTLQNEGTYVYYITATDNVTGKEITQKGNITLIK